MMERTLKPYMIYSRELGARHGAYLVFARNRQQARLIGYDGDIADTWIDCAVNRINDNYIYKYANQDYLKSNTPHTIKNPPSCSHCHIWSVSELDENGLCQDCRK